MFYLRNLLFIISIIVLHSCEYQLNDVYNNPVKVEVKAPDLSAVSLNLDINADTVYLYDSKAVKFSFRTKDRSIQAVELLIDGAQQEVIVGDIGQFNGINHYSLQEGNHSLQLNIYTNTGTGSIADQLNQESFLLSRKWVMYVDKTFDERKETNIKDGLLQLSWAQNKNSTFKEFVVYKNLEWESVEIGRTTDTHFTDQSYVGEECTYYVKAIDGDEVFQWCYFSMEMTIPKPYINKNKGSEYELYNPQCKYYNAVDSVIIEEYVYYEGWKRIKQTDEVTDTITPLTNAYFSHRCEYRLILVPKTDEKVFYHDNIRKFTNEFSGYIGFDIEQKEYNSYTLFPINEQEVIIEGNNSTLVTYSFDTMEKLDEASFDDDKCHRYNFYSINLSASGKHLCCYFGCNDDILFTQTKPVSFDQMINLTHYHSEGWLPKILVSDVGLCVVPDRNAGQKVLYNYKLGEEVLRFENSNMKLQLSFNGQYYWGCMNGEDTLLKFTSEGQVETVWQAEPFTPYTEFFEFSAVNEHEAVIWDEKDLRIIDCRTFDAITSFPLSDDRLCDVDHFKQQLLTYNDNKLFVRNLVTGEVLHTIQLNPNVYNWGNGFTLLNNKVFNENGVVYFL
ncbi:MAG: hypothetical protein N4A74_24480 [Carboxylicivirga sp.]|jgi:hypothetical protein|nr:hypothetical protein [Carboxylicivirga sp.]